MEIPERIVATVEVSDDAMPPTYTPVGKLLRLHPASLRSLSLGDDALSPARFSVRLCDVDPNLFTKLKTRLALAMRIDAVPLQINFIATFIGGDDREMEFQMVNEPTFSMVA